MKKKLIVEEAVKIVCYSFLFFIMLLSFSFTSSNSANSMSLFLRNTKKDELLLIIDSKTKNDNYSYIKSYFEPLSTRSNIRDESIFISSICDNSIIPLKIESLSGDFHSSNVLCPLFPSPNSFKNDFVLHDEKKFILYNAYENPEYSEKNIYISEKTALNILGSSNGGAIDFSPLYDKSINAKTFLNYENRTTFIIKGVIKDESIGIYRNILGDEFVISSYNQSLYHFGNKKVNLIFDNKIESVKTFVSFLNPSINIEKYSYDFYSFESGLITMEDGLFDDYYSNLHFIENNKDYLIPLAIDILCSGFFLVLIRFDKFRKINIMCSFMISILIGTIIKVFRFNGYIVGLLSFFGVSISFLNLIILFVCAIFLNKSKDIIEVHI